ncbi:LYR motif-containing protein 2 isoform X1 [Trichosurus vulpecula]|uniref:LYR motif-containing protein 2 isoform X1 n=1 Tax=Trichosurus vulpecula TaxID=9337 RepID=UPI00186AE0AF|nr:LYR motif-containing protein 2 isoform X1 [Trichosurus vulpecula]
MSSTRLPPVALTLKQFMRRQQVLLLYRRVLRAIRQVPNERDRKYLENWAREEFQRNKSATEEVRMIKSSTWWRQPPLSLLSSFFSLIGYNPNDDYSRKSATERIGENIKFSKSVTS